MARLAPKPSVIKKLFALSGNKCAFPDCSENLVTKDGELIGEICHIEAAEPAGPRYNPISSDEERRSIENLILMCPIHHKITDNIEKYSVRMLSDFKSKQEKKFRNSKFTIAENIAKKLIQKYMSQKNKNLSSGVQINNQAETQNIGTQVGTQNYYYNSNNESFKMEGARIVNKQYKEIIDKFKQKASPPSTEVIDFKNELLEKFERPVELIPTKLLKFRKDNGRIIADVESFEKERNIILKEDDLQTQELLRKFLRENDKESNEELKKLLSHKTQQRPAIITCDGYLINGNRRKMVLEELYKSNNDDPRFEMMRVVVLPEGVTELDIQKIENRYQLQSEGKSEYQGLNRAIKIKRNIERGFTLEAQLRDDPKYHDLIGKEFEKIVKEYEKNYLKPLDCVNRYLDTFSRKGLYNTISETSGDNKGRWQAFIDYSNFYYGTLENKARLHDYSIKETEVRKIENAIFKIIRKRVLNSKELEGTIGKVHDFVRKAPKYLKNQKSKKFLLKIADDVNEDIPESLKYDKMGNKYNEREIDEKWGDYYRKEILGNLIQAHKIVVNQEERDKPIELLEDALKKLRHENLKIKNMDIKYYEKAMSLTLEINAEADALYSAIDKARFELSKLKRKN